MGSIVEDHNGSIIDYVGDGLLAVVGKASLSSSWQFR
jgi:class 3 adenylate cyclase